MRCVSPGVLCMGNVGMWGWILLLASCGGRWCADPSRQHPPPQPALAKGGWRRSRRGDSDNTHPGQDIPAMAVRGNCGWELNPSVDDCGSLTPSAPGALRTRFPPVPTKEGACAIGCHSRRPSTPCHFLFVYSNFTPFLKKIFSKTPFHAIIRPLPSYGIEVQVPYLSAVRVGSMKP